MDTRTKQDSRVRRYGYAARNSACGAPYLTGNKAEVCQYSSVTSYRGRHEYLTVGHKRRKTFHDFQRYKMSWDNQVPWWHCDPSGYRIYCTDSYARCNTGEIVDFRNSPSFDTYYGGSDLPLATQSMIAEYAEDLREFVIRDLYAKATSPRFDGAVFLAELDETLVGIHKLLLGSVKSLFKAKEARRNLKHLVLNPEDLWLWWRYMLMPTMMDVEDLLKAIKPQEVIDRVQDGDRIDLQKTNGRILSHKWFGAYNSTIEYPWVMEHKAGLGGAIDIYSRSDPFEWGTSPWDVVRATWERIPFSFVADWFINVGDWLSSLRSLEIVYAQSYATYAVDVKVTFPNGENQGQDGLPCNRYFLMDRITNVEPPALPLVDKRWQSCLRTIDLISLTIGMLKGILKRRR